MPGLLDIFNTDEGRLGLGLLAAAAPRTDGAGFGQRLNEAFSGMDARQKQKLEMDLIKAHTAQYAAQAAAQEAQARAAEEKQRTISNFFGNSPTAALQQGAAVGDIGPTVTNAARMNNSGFTLAGMHPNQIAQLKAMGGIDLLPEWNAVNVGSKIDADSFRQLPGQAPKFFAKPTSGVTFDENGAIKLIPGAENLSKLEGDKTAAQKRAEAGYQLVSYTPKGAENPISMTLQQRIDQLTQPEPQFVPQPQPTSRQKESGYAGGSPQAAAVDQRALLEQELRNPKLTPEDRAAINREIFRLPKATNHNALQSEAEKASQLGKVENVTKAGNEINNTWLKTSYEPAVASAKAAQDLIETTKVARDAMQKLGGTGWGTGAKSAAANVLSGLGVASNNVNMYASNAQIFQKSAMDRLWTTLNDAKGPQTEGDADRASKTYASLGNTTKANEFILDLAQAKSEREKARASFYQSALPIAKERGDLSEIEREWQARQPSIFSMPVMKKWGIK